MSPILLDDELEMLEDFLKVQCRINLGVSSEENSQNQPGLLDEVNFFNSEDGDHSGGMISYRISLSVNLLMDLFFISDDE